MHGEPLYCCSTRAPVIKPFTEHRFWLPPCDSQRTTLELPLGLPPIHTRKSPLHWRSTQTPLLSQPHVRPCVQAALPNCCVNCALRTQPFTGQCRKLPSIDLQRTVVEFPVFPPPLHP